MLEKLGKDLIWCMKRVYAFLLAIRIDLEVSIVKLCYKRTITRIRKKRAFAKRVKVCFLVSNSSKWKCQALFDKMVLDPYFEPYIGFAAYDTEEGMNSVKLTAYKNKMYDFFRDRVPKSSIMEFYNRPIRRENFDLVFYQSPWGCRGRCISPFLSALGSLLFYVPYYIPSTFDPGIGIMQFFHRLQFRNYVISAQVADVYGDCVRKSGKSYAGEIRVAGHPMLDLINDNKSGDIIVYAPHWSIIHPNYHNGVYMSTFLANGRAILEYVKRHPEQHWVFKPHPFLKEALKVAWSEQEISDYYQEWESVGEVCYTGEYVELFERSRVMVTDCDSFLTEYGVTGKPVIFLYGEKRKDMKHTFCGLYESYYKVSNNQQLFMAVREVVECRKDPKMMDRRNALQQLGLMHKDSADRIIADIKNVLG